MSNSLSLGHMGAFTSGPVAGSSRSTDVVRPNDRLTDIARQVLGSSERWQEIAAANGSGARDRILIGQPLSVARPVDQSPLHPPTVIARPDRGRPMHEQPATAILGRVHLFVMADEPNPFTRRVVRKVLLPPRGVTAPGEITRLTHPERHGFRPRDPMSNVGPGRHVGGRVDSRFTSASNEALGSPRFKGGRFFINVSKARAAGVTLHETPAIIADLDRVIARTADPTRQARLRWIRDKALTVDREVLLEGAVPASAVKTGSMMALTRGAQGVSGVGILITAYDVARAGERAHDQHSIRPLAVETVRQTGGWAGAWAGMQIGGSLGTLVGIEAGPGALVTGLVGGIVGGLAGFTGAEWAARWIEH